MTRVSPRRSPALRAPILNPNRFGKPERSDQGAASARFLLTRCQKPISRFRPESGPSLDGIRRTLLLSISLGKHTLQACQLVLAQVSEANPEESTASVGVPARADDFSRNTLTHIGQVESHPLAFAWQERGFDESPPDRQVEGSSRHGESTPFETALER